MAAVIGHPVAHSLSPSIHNAAFRSLGLDWVYVALDVPEGQVPQAIAGVRSLGVAGLSVTMPHKSEVARHMDRLTADAELLGAVNCVQRVGDELVGDNTDGEGFLRSLRADGAFEPQGHSCVVLGAGGAARAVIVALARAGAAEVVVVNRDQTRAEAAAALAGPSGRVAGLEAVREATLIVNATPVGMGADWRTIPFDPSSIHGRQVIADLVYEPRQTSLVRAARERGAVAINGLGMLVQQAAVAFERWTGREAPVGLMARVAGSQLG